MTKNETFNDLLGDVFDIRDVINRFEEIEDVIADEDEDEDIDERTAIQSFFDDVRGCGGDHQWRGDWYPCTFIADRHFEQYAEEFADAIGAIDRNSTWPCCYIDWKAAAESLQQDYSSVEINGDTYWYR